MKVLQILVWLLLLMVCYDVVNYFLLPANEKDSESNSDANDWKYLGFFGGQELFIGDFYQWIIGGLCLLSLVLLRLVYRRTFPKSVDMWTSLHPGSLEKGLDILKPKRKDSFLTCGISNTTLDSSYIDDQAFEFPGRLSSEQLQVLLEELKFRTDEKFEGIDSWIQSSSKDSKQVLKRMERIETEISYIRHQIFVLMSTNAKGGVNLGIGDIPDNKEHLNTLRDLSDILAQVKKQFKEDECNKEIKESGDHDEEKLNQKEADKENDECEGPGKDECIVKEQEESDEENDPISKESKPQKKESVEKIVETEPPKPSPCADDNLAKPIYLEPESDISISWKNKEESFTTRTSNKDDSFVQNPIDYEKEEENKDQWPFSCLDEMEPVYHLQENLIDELSKDTRMNPELELDYICNERMSLSPAGDGNHEYNKNQSVKVEIKEVITKNSKNLSSNHNEYESPSINTINAANAKPDIGIPTKDKQIIDKISVIKRTVTFAPEKRSLSPSKIIPWLPLIKKDVSPSREQEHKDYKIPVLEPVKGRRQSISCPAVEDRRPSRRIILERELTNLERRVSPTRSKQNRKNVRSKVAEYIRGVK